MKVAFLNNIGEAGYLKKCIIATEGEDNVENHCIKFWKSIDYDEVVVQN